MNEIKEFFNMQASTWDKREKHTEEELDLFIRAYVELEDGNKVLDLGCGTGIITNILYNITNCDVDAIDISNEMINIAKNKYNNDKIHFICDDFYNLNTKYDHIICFNAYPHFLDVLKFKEKIYEILNDDGKLTIIHNLSRHSLDRHHSGIFNISRKLPPIIKEAEIYKDKFEILNIIDNDEMILLSMKKMN